MNSNTIISLRGGTGAQNIATLAPASTTETAFALVTGGGVATIVVPKGTEVLGSSNPQDPNVNPALLSYQYGRQMPVRGSNAPYYNSASFDSGKPFTVKAYGTVTTAGAYTVLYDLVLGNSATFGSNAPLSVSVASPTISTATTQWYVSAFLQWDSTSEVLNGTYTSLVASTGTATGPGITEVIATPPTAVTLALLKFSCFAKFSNAAAGNTTTCTEFSLEQS